MIRGTSAPFTFKMPIKCSQVQNVEIKFWQRNNHGTSTMPLPITIRINEGSDLLTVDPESYELNIELEPAQTRAFSDKRKASVQGIITSTDGKKYGIKETLITVDSLYKDSDVTISDIEDGDIVILDGYEI